jgi:glycosyltransferase involved in cell wall biosynthesis
MVSADSLRKIRLLIVTNSLDKGGVEEVILMYAKFLDRRRYDVAVAYRKGGHTVTELSALPSLHLYCYDGDSRWVRMKNLLGFFDVVRPDILHNHFSWLGAIAGYVKSIPCVETIHNVYGFFSTGQRIAYSFLAMFVQRFIAVSREVKEYSAKTFFFLSRGKITVIHNGVDTVRFQPLQDKSAVRASLGLVQDNFVIGFVGRLEEQKGIRYLLESAKELNVSYAHLTFVIAGEGTFRRDLQEMTASLGLHNVIFLGYRRDTPELYNAFDVFVLPSLYEGFPISVIEAMSSGCAVVATRTGGTGEAIDHERTGLLIEPKQSHSVTDALKTLINTPRRGVEMGKKGREKVLEDFSAEAMIFHTEKVYADLVPHLYKNFSLSANDR